MAVIKHYLIALIVLVCGNCVAQSPEQNLEKMGVNLPALSAPIASYVHAVRVGDILYLSGKGPQDSNGQYIKGKLGKDMNIEQGKVAAQSAGIQLLAVLKSELKDLAKVKRIVKATGFVNSESDFYGQSQVMNGFSDFMIRVFGEKGRHARSAIGVAALPNNMAVEVELIVEVE
jgi:enamine deaminase RidA (YjgF/YER057c/UK114 family)